VAGTNFVNSSWTAPDLTPFSKNSATNINLEKWISLDNWDTKKQIGEWNIDAFYGYTDTLTDPVGHGSANFSVNPEPASVALFLLGGAALAARQSRKKKQLT
jgi:hypothetical protein